MHVEEFLNTVQIPEWAAWYIPYKKLKNAVHARASSIPNLSDVTHKSSFVARKRGNTLKGKRAPTPPEQSGAGAGAASNQPATNGSITSAGSHNTFPSSPYASPTLPPSDLPHHHHHVHFNNTFSLGSAGPPASASTSRQGSFAGASFAAALNNMGKQQPLHLYFHVKLTAQLDLEIQHVEYRVGSVTKKRRVLPTSHTPSASRTVSPHDHPDENEPMAGDLQRNVSFRLGDAISMMTPHEKMARQASQGGGGPEAMNSSFVAEDDGAPEMTEEEHIALMRVEQLVASIRALNKSITTELKDEVEKVTQFYQRQAHVVATAAGVAIDRAKVYNKLSRKDQEQVDTLFRKVTYSLNMLQQFCDQNYLIVAKLLQKLQEATKQDIHVGNVLEELPFFVPASSGPVHMLRELVSTEFTDRICGGNHSVALERLNMRNDSEGSAYEPSSMLILGCLVGSIVALSIVCIIMFIQVVNDDHLLYNANNNTYLFGVSGTIILLAILFPLNVIIWERSNINYIFSLHLHPLNHWTPIALLKDHCFYAMAWIICVYGFLHAAQEELFFKHELRAVRAEQDAIIRELILSAPPNTTTDYGYTITKKDFLSSFANATELMGSAVFSYIMQNNPDANSTDLIVIPNGEKWFTDAELEKNFVHYPRTNFDAWIWPYLVFPACFVVFCGIHIVHRDRSAWFLTTFKRVLCTPFYHVEFPDFFLCEQLVSLSATFFEVTFMWCIFHSDAVQGTCDYSRGHQIFPLLLLPSIWRVLQSFRRYYDEASQRGFYPHMLNALKYTISSLKFTAFALKGMASFAEAPSDQKNAALVLYIVFSVIDMFFKCWYELWIEFGVMRWNARNFMLRDELLFPKWCYYLGIINNIAMRVLWIFQLLAAQTWDSEWIFPVFAAAEIWRRFVWNIFRVENDQVDNTEHYKVVKLAPLLMQQRSRAVWEVNMEELEEKYGEFEEIDNGMAFRTFNDIVEFFRELPRVHRVAILRSIMPELEPPSDPYQEGESFPEVVRRNTSSTVRTSDDDGVGSNNSFKAKNDRVMFFPDLRSAGSVKRKTTIKMFTELRGEDKARALLLTMGQSTVSKFLRDIELPCDLEEHTMHEQQETNRSLVSQKPIRRFSTKIANSEQARQHLATHKLDMGVSPFISKESVIEESTNSTNGVVTPPYQRQRRNTQTFEEAEPSFGPIIASPTGGSDDGSPQSAFVSQAEMTVVLPPALTGNNGGTHGMEATLRPPPEEGHVPPRQETNASTDLQGTGAQGSSTSAGSPLRRDATEAPMSSPIIPELEIEGPSPKK